MLVNWSRTWLRAAHVTGKELHLPQLELVRTLTAWARPCQICTTRATRANVAHPNDGMPKLRSQVRAAIEVDGTHYVTFEPGKLVSAIASDANLPPDRVEIR